ncbi:hypothetical protein ABMA28_012603 [Loxostege sticticalis]|uniref:Regulatory protein zeste n=1 Tax=Loxostege sticticalis TaxID=481309 RepID=A0ABD0S6J4_LOXSC
MESKKHVFTPIEKRIFRDIIRTYSTIIESKDTDGATLRTKNEAWVRIAAEFNASPHTTFNKATSKQLRRLWANLKQRQKEYQRRLLGRDPLSEGDQEMYAPIIVKNDSYSAENARSEDSSDSHSRSHHSFTPDNHNHDRTTPIIPLIPKLLNSSSNGTQHDKIMEMEYKERMRRFDETHELEMLILKEKLREARAKADLAEVILRQHSSGDGQSLTRNLRYEE